MRNYLKKDKSFAIGHVLKTLGRVNQNAHKIGVRLEFFGDSIFQMSQKLCSFYRVDICPQTIMAKTALLPRLVLSPPPPPCFPKYPLINNSCVGSRASVAGGNRTSDRNVATAAQLAITLEIPLRSKATTVYLLHFESRLPTRLFCVSHNLPKFSPQNTIKSLIKIKTVA